jgi:predicted AlkP superfamily pyrophosphatase or phosphodiesterase
MFYKFKFVLVLITTTLINKCESRPYINELDILNNQNNESLLILISFDGFRWDYLENHTLPYLNKYFVEDGVKVKKGLKNAFTTVTFPNHWSLATGLYPESHGNIF